MHYCYILYNTCCQKSYVGYTVNPIRRLRQHNGVIQGGAKYTQNNKGTWEFLIVITSTSFTKQIALSLEWHVKHRNHNKGPLARVSNLLYLLSSHPRFQGHQCDMYVSKHLQTRAEPKMIDIMIEQYDCLILHDDLSYVIDVSE